MAVPDAETRRGVGSTTVHKRFWVRGHWRRPNQTWSDQRLRWIEPYLKGPDAAAIIEREYELVGAEALLERKRDVPPG